MTYVQQLDQQIATRLADVREQISRLTAAREVLVSFRARERNSSPKPRRASTDDVAELVSAGVGEARAISRALGVHGRSTIARLRELEREGRIRATAAGWVPRA